MHACIGKQPLEGHLHPQICLVVTHLLIDNEL